jgi:hypothetical protein
MATSLKDRFPREWAIVSNTVGDAIIPRSAWKRLKTLTGESLDPATTSLEEFESRLVAACEEMSVKLPAGSEHGAKHKRWARLRAAVSKRGLALSNKPGQIPCVNSLRTEPIPSSVDMIAFADGSPMTRESAKAVPVTFVSDTKTKQAPVLACTVCCELAPTVKLQDLVSGSRAAASASGAGTAKQARVDNTGNVRTWPAEEVLALLLWRWRSQNRLREWHGRAIMEIGAGQSGESVVH